MGQTVRKVGSIMDNLIIRLPTDIHPQDIVFIDGERTFPEGECQTRRWMELAMIDGAGSLLYHSYFDPGMLVENRFIKKGLTDDILIYAPTFDSQWCHIQSLLKCKHVVAWWAEMERKFFPDQLACAKKVHCAQARFSPLASDYNMRYADYKAVGMWEAFDMLQLQEPSGHRHRAHTDVQAMRQIWNWLEQTKPANLIFEAAIKRISGPFN